MTDETTTEQLVEIEGQAAQYTPPEGWRVLRFGEQLLPGDVWVSHDGTEHRSSILQWDAAAVLGGHCIRRIEPQPEPQPVQIREESCPQLHPWLRTPPEQQVDRIITTDDVAAEALAGVNEWPSVQALRRQLETTEAALLEQQQRNEQLVTHGSQQHMEIAELQAQVAFLKNRELTLGTRLEEEKAVTTKRLQQVEELRNEVSYVQGLLGDERRRFAELETLASDLRAVNAAQEKAMNSTARDKADLQHRLDTVAAEWALQAETIRGLEALLEAVKAELSQVSRDRYLLQIELDAREQVPEAVSDRFDQGFEQGTARAVETIAEWLEPLRKGNCTLRAAVLFHLPAIMRSLTGLADED